MRILFLNSSLEPTRDGVGDYTRLLAGACVRQGHSCGMIALHDGHVAEPVASGEPVEKGEIPWLRLPTSMAWPRRIELAATFRSRFDPDWISFQFVPYGFQDKGIVFNLNRGFRALTRGCPLHLMFHELWIGAATGSPVRHRLIGALQRVGIQRMVSLLKPQRVTTSNPAYISTLKSRGIHASLLPLFGNIPVASIDSGVKLPEGLAEAGLPQNHAGRADWWVGIFFGTLHPDWKPEPLMSILLRTARRANKRVCLLRVGRTGAAGEAIWTNLEREYGTQATLATFGEQSVETVSTLLQIANFGIAASPWQLIGKSGSVAAMLDHGLSVIVTRDDYQPPMVPDAPPSRDPLFHACDETLESKLLAGLPKRPAHARLGDVAAQFSQLLSAHAADFSDSL